MECSKLVCLSTIAPGLCNTNHNRFEICFQHPIYIKYDFSMLIQIHFSYACELAQMSNLQNDMIICNFIFTYRQRQTECEAECSYVMPVLPLPLAPPMLRVVGLSHSCPTYSLNSRLLNVPLIPCTRACATVTVHQPTSHPAATIIIPALLLAAHPPPPDPAFSISNLFLNMEYKKQAKRTITQISLSSPATPCSILILPLPPHPFPVLASS